jgi:tetratricopeptide (TPR) repeat protein
MKRTTTLAAAAALSACCWTGGCNDTPKLPKAPDGKELTVLAVDAADPAEQAAVEAAENARVNYRYRIQILERYYKLRGHLLKLRWARRELENLEQAQPFTFEGVEMQPPPPESYADADERLLAEYAVAARKRWLAALDALEKVYADKGKGYERRIVQVVRRRLDPVKTYTYVVEGEIPGPELRPTTALPQADDLFREACALQEAGEGFLHNPLTFDRDQLRGALEKFLRLVHEYPDSDKIALSAFRIGEIYEEAFDEHVRALTWYERAMQWDPFVPEPARFRAARIYDLHVRNRDKAVELYRQSLEKDPWRPRIRDTAAERIEALTRRHLR